MDDVFGIYAVGNSAEEQLVREHDGGIAVGYPPPLVLNVEQPADLHRFLELKLNTGEGTLQCQLFNPVYSAVKTRGRVLQRLPEHGGGTAERDRLSWIIGVLFRMAYGCLAPTDVALSVCELAVELELSGTSSPRYLLGVAPGAIAKGECDHTGNSGGEDERVFRNLGVPIQDAGRALKLLSETP